MKERYSFSCAKCEYKMQFAPSIGMRLFGTKDLGHGTCLECKTFLHIEIDENDNGKSEIWDEYMKKIDPCII